MSETAAARARELVLFCDGIDDTAIPCLHTFAARGRLVAADVLDLVDALTAERSARRAIQERHELLLDRLALLHGAQAVGEVWP